MLERIVGIHQPWRSDEIILFQRNGEHIDKIIESFSPFILANHELKDSDQIELTPSDNFYNRLLFYENPAEHLKAAKSLDRSLQYGWMDVAIQYLMLSGERMYQSMDFSDLHRMQIGLNSSFVVRTPDGCVHHHDKGARDLVPWVNALFTEYDPDVIEAWDVERVFGYLLNQARSTGARLDIAREGSAYYRQRKEPVLFEQLQHRSSIDIPGREVIEVFKTHYKANGTMHLYRDLNPETVLQHYGLQKDILGLARLAEITGRANFLLAKLFPIPMGRISYTGDATVINTGIMQEYLRRGLSIPKGGEAAEITGGLVEMYQTGMGEEVFRIDFRSMYPSIMLNEGLVPENDYLGVFPRLLKEILDARLHYKAMRNTFRKNSIEYQVYDMIQNRFKILANTFYGYMFAPYHPFKDSGTAQRLTARGQELIKSVMGMLEENGMKIYSVNTDGCIFSGRDVERVVQQIQDKLPAYMRLEFEGPWRGLFKSNNNYMLLGDTIELKGNSFRGKNLPPFIIDFIQESAALLKAKDTEGIERLYKSYYQKILHRKLAAEDVSVTSEIKHSLALYSHMNKQQHMELALRTGRYRQGDFITYYVSGLGIKGGLSSKADLIVNYEPYKLNVKHYLELLQSKKNEILSLFV